MTVSPESGSLPPRQHTSCDEMRGSDDELHDERSSLIRLALAALVSWATTLRLLAVLVAVAVIVLLAVWLLPIDVEIGPVKLTRRTPAEAAA